jgi:putative FmdB family regulatory protein
MPIYEYECAKCGPYEVTQKITEKALTRCEKCGGKKVHRLISSSSFSLKGGGWYSDLYSGGSKSKGDSSSSSAPTKSDSLSKAKSESKSTSGGEKSAA